MLRCILLAGMAALLISQPALAVLKGYVIEGDQSTLTPTDGTTLRPGTIVGNQAIIDDAGDGTPTLVSLEVVNAWTDSLGATTTTTVPGSTVALDSVTTAGPSAGQTGSGDTASSISWGVLTGWTQTGYLTCISNCPGGPCPASACIPFIGFEGTGPPAPLSATAFDSDPWTFAGDGSSFAAPSVEMVNLSGGGVTVNLQWGSSTRTFPVPALPLVGLGVLGSGLVYLAARAIRRD